MVFERFNAAANGLSAPIPPLNPVTGWKELPIQECGEPLVPLGPFSKYPEIFQDAIYAGERTSSPYARGELNGGLVTPFVRKGIAEQLATAAQLLPEGYALMIWDSFRPLAVQQALYDDFYKQLVDVKGLSPDEATIEAQRFVSIPSLDPNKPPPHFTGATVDLTLVKFPEDCWQELKMLNEQLKSSDEAIVTLAEMRRLELLREKAAPVNMGTSFDEVSPRTETRYYEEKLTREGHLTPNEQECLDNRRILFNAMHKAGFSGYPEEWWHFDSGNQFDAIRTGNAAKYGAASFTPECADWEAFRRSLPSPAPERSMHPKANRLHVKGYSRKPAHQSKTGPKAQNLKIK